jgi:hypothetical protein
LDAAFLAVARLSSGKGMGKDDVLGYVVALFLHIFATATIFIVTIAMRATTLQKSRVGHVGASFDTRRADLTGLMNKSMTLGTLPYFNDEKNATTGAAILHSGKAMLTKFEGLCKGEEVHEALHYLMFFLWISFIGPKILDAVFRMQVLVQIPSSGVPDAAPEEITKKGVPLTNIDCVSKLLVLVVVVLPHLLTNVLAAWVGLQFLAMEAAVGTLLMKALIMKTVTMIEAPVLKNFATNTLSGCMKLSTFVLPIQEGSKKDKASINYNTWGAPIVKFLVFFFIGVIYYKMQWADLLLYRSDCTKIMGDMGVDSVEMRCIAHGIPGNTCGFATGK